MKLLAMLFVCGLVGCGSPSPKGGAASSGPDALYRVEDHPGGFTISTKSSGYQSSPESKAVQLACKQGLLTAARDLAESLGRKIEQIDEQRLRISVSRNGVTGIPSCEASVPVRWARP